MTYAIGLLAHGSSPMGSVLEKAERCHEGKRLEYQGKGLEYRQPEAEVVGLGGKCWSSF